jgi:TRAP-type C4-dicarboxylate transport system permease large subunit
MKACVAGQRVSIPRPSCAISRRIIQKFAKRLAVLVLIIVAYTILGMFLESIAMLVLTIPVVIPIAVGLEWDLIWFGIIVVIVLEMGMISPPVGINVFIVKSIAPDVPMREIFIGIFPFWLAVALMLVLLIAFPALATFLPQTLTG